MRINFAFGRNGLPLDLRGPFRYEVLEARYAPTLAAGHYPLNTMPLYVRAGSIVPMGPVMQYATEKLDVPYEDRIYPGANAKFTLYEDDNETYNYEKGEYATYELSWNDAAKVLTVGKRKGNFPGMIEKHVLRVELAGPDANSGIAEGTTKVKTVTCGNQKIEVRF